MKLDFYYWSCQCPLNYEMLQLLEEYKDKLDINLYDITGRPELAKQMRMFYPTLTVVNNRFRHYSPVTQKFLEALCNGVISEEAPYRPRLGTKEFTGDILPITSENYELAGACTGRTCWKACGEKVQFFKENNITVYGFMNVQGNELLGGVEYMPSKLAPYDILKDDKTAFLTCVYLSDETYDYKSAPLRVLEKYLAKAYIAYQYFVDKKLGNINSCPLPYLGISYNNEQIRDALERKHISYKYYENRDDLCKIIATEIYNNKIIVFFTGRSEVGPRALCHRSLLANGTWSGMKDYLNKKVKHREKT